MVSLENYCQAFKKMPSCIKEAEVNGESHDVVIVEVSNQQVVDYQIKYFTDLYIRVAGNKNGYVYTQNLNEEPLELLQKAYQNSLYSEKETLENMNRINKQTIYKNECAVSDVEVLKKKALEIESYLQEKLGKDVNLDVVLHAETYGQNTVNSYGFKAVNYVPLYLLEVAASGKGASAMLDQSKNSLDGFDLDYFATNLNKRLSWQQNVKSGFKSGMYNVVFSQEAAYNMLATAWQELAANKYNENGSIYAGCLNQQVMAECLNFTDYTTVCDSGFEFNCDCEGSQGKNTDLVVDGKLVGLMTNTTTAENCGLENSGNGGRRPLLFGNIATDILVTPKNFCLKPGKSTLEQLVKNMGNGILITEYFDIFHSLNIASGDFNVPCYGVLVENGEMVGNLKALNMSGNLKDLLLSAKEVGSDFIVRPMNYLNNYGIGTSSIRFGQVAISGE